jgi:hypothetical protein
LPTGDASSFAKKIHGLGQSSVSQKLMRIDGENACAGLPNMTSSAGALFTD